MRARFLVLMRSSIVALLLLGGSVVTLDLMAAGIRASEVGKQEPLTIATATGTIALKVEIADNEASREEGLMFRPAMAADEGMLFDFKATNRVYFWMKNTYISLDMIFIRADGTVAHIAEHATPLSEKTVPSEEPVRFVLEVNSGTAQRIGLKVGDKVQNRLMRAPAG